MSGKKLIVSLVAVAALLGAVPSDAAEQTPEGYKEAVEPICKRNVEANEEILDGVQKNIRAGELKKVSRQFFAAAKALKKARGQLLQVPKPSEDAARLTKWLKGIKTEAELFEAAARKFAHDEKTAALRTVIKLESNARQTNNLVLSYEFRYCRQQPSKYR